MLVKEAACPNYPARCAGVLAGVAEVEDEPEDTARSLIGMTLRQIAAMRTVQQADRLLIVTEHMGRDSGTLEILGS
jgi:hypothetical protein